MKNGPYAQDVTVFPLKSKLPATKDNKIAGVLEKVDQEWFRIRDEKGVNTHQILKSLKTKITDNSKVRPQGHRLQRPGQQSWPPSGR